MKRFLFILSIAFFSHAWCKDSTGNVVLLKGPCSVGKSSICKALAQSTKSWKAIDDDEYHIKMTLATLAKKFPEQFEVIKCTIKKCNRYHAIQRRDVLFKSKASEDQKQETIKCLDTISAFFRDNKEYITYTELLDRNTRQKILQRINRYASKGKNVIVDTWLLNEDDFSQIRERYSLFKGIAYAPLQTLLNRVLKRNKAAQETGNLISKRFIRQPLYSFRHLYNFSTEPTSGIMLDTLQKDQFIECIEFARSQLTIHREITSQELDAYKKRMLEKLSGEKLFITADPSYDFVIHTTAHTPEFYAKLIRKKVKSLNKE